MERIRTFIALPLPSELKQRMSILQSELRAAGAEAKWDTPDKFHITLKFLGDTERGILASLSESLRTSLADVLSFELSFEGVGAFPSIEKPRVVWISTRENKMMETLQQRVEQVSSQLGFPREDRHFHAHVTLGRVKGNRALDRLTASLKSVTFEPSIARCTEIQIMRSDLKPTGSVYTLIQSIPLIS